MDESTLMLHSRTQDETLIYEFKVRVIAFNHIDDVISNTLTDHEFRRLYNEGDGITSLSLEHPHLRFNVRLIDKWQRQIAVFESALDNYFHPDYYHW